MVTLELEAAAWWVASATAVRNAGHGLRRCRRAAAQAGGLYSVNIAVSNTSFAWTRCWTQYGVAQRRRSSVRPTINTRREWRRAGRTRSRYRPRRYLNVRPSGGARMAFARLCRSRLSASGSSRTRTSPGLTVTGGLTRVPMCGHPQAFVQAIADRGPARAARLHMRHRQVCRPHSLGACLPAGSRRPACARRRHRPGSANEVLIPPCCGAL